MSSKDWSVLFDLFSYEDGKLIWKTDRGSQKVKGQEAGCFLPTGYKVVTIRDLCGQTYVHRIVFYLFNNYMPEMVDHINNNPSDNRIENLRACNRSQNFMNKPAHKNSTTKHKNVYFNKRLNTFFVQIKADGKRMYVGGIKSIEEANKIAIDMRNKYHTEFANHGAAA